MSGPTRNICITAVDGQIGFRIAQAILSQEKFRKNITSLIGLTLRPQSPEVGQLEELGAKIAQHVPGSERQLARNLKQMGCDMICLVPPAHENKLNITLELISAARKAGVSNVLLISFAGAEYATKEKQPRLREFIELETAVLSGAGSLGLGHSSCVIRIGLLFESLLHGPKQAHDEGFLPLPLGPNHKFAPLSLLEVADVAGHVLTGRGKNGFDDSHLGQIMVVTGSKLYTGDELAALASKALCRELEYEEISEASAKLVSKTQYSTDPYEIEFLLEFYSLVREGKTNYIATTALHFITGAGPILDLLWVP